MVHRRGCRCCMCSSLYFICLELQRPVDPASLFAQFYCSGASTDGHISSFSLAGVVTNYSDNVATLATQTSLSSHEGGTLWSYLHQVKLHMQLKLQGLCRIL